MKPETRDEPQDDAKAAPAPDTRAPWVRPTLECLPTAATEFGFVFMPESTTFS